MMVQSVGCLSVSSTSTPTGCVRSTHTKSDMRELRESFISAFTDLHTAIHAYRPWPQLWRSSDDAGAHSQSVSMRWWGYGFHQKPYVFVSAWSRGSLDGDYKAIAFDESKNWRKELCVVQTFKNYIRQEKRGGGCGGIFLKYPKHLVRLTSDLWPKILVVTPKAYISSQLPCSDRYPTCRTCPWCLSRRRIATP